jgi:hypothetical protein
MMERLEHDSETVPGFDLAISYYNGLDHLPEFRVDSSQLMQPQPELVLISEFYRQQVTGSNGLPRYPTE